MTQRLLAGMFVIWLAVPGNAENRLAPDLSRLSDESTLDVIVQFTSTLTERHHEMVRRRGGELKHDLSGALNGAHYSIPAKRLAELSQDPEVAYISPDRPVHAMLDYANPTVNANIARQYGWDGAGVGIALIDSGLQGRPDLNPTSKGSSARIVYNASFLPSTLSYFTSTNDDYGHGTHVAGILAGNGSMSECARCTRNFIGIAPNANIINLRVLDAGGNGTDSSVINAIGAAISLAKTYNIKVINLSLGRPIYESYTLDPLCQAVESAWKRGIVVVVAAGNNGRDNSHGTNGYGTIAAPANDPYVITVGAMKDMRTITRTDDLIASYSSKGPTLLDYVVKPDIVAPGNRVISLIQAGSYIYQNSSSVNEIPHSYYISGGAGTSTMYYQLSGTSMAAPMVSGAAALLFQQNSALTPDQVKARLMKTSTKTFPSFSVATDPVAGISYTSQYDIFTIGAGYLDVWAALNNTDLAPPQVGSALSPTATYDPTSESVYVNGNPVAVWGSSAAWSISVVWGTSVVVTADRKNVVWGSSTGVWDSSGAQGINALWNLWSVVWGDSNNTAESLSQLINGEN
jgi:serine protease AprX